MGGFVDKANGWMAVFRLVTPALLGVLLWIVQDSRTSMSVQVAELRKDIHEVRLTVSNHIQAELSGIKERLSSVETALKLRL